MTKRGMVPLQLVLSYQNLLFLDSNWIAFGSSDNAET